MEELKIPNITYFNAIIERHRKIYGPDLQNCLEDEGAFFPFDSITKNDLIQDFGLEEDEAKYCLEELEQMGSMDINQIVYEFRKVYVITCNHWISHREESNDNEAYQNLSQQKDIFDVIIESYTHMEKNSSSSMTASYPERNEDTEFDIDNLTKSMEKKLDSQLELQKLIDNYMSLLYQKIQTKVVEVVHEKLENSQFPIIIQKKCDIYGRSFIEKVLYRPCGLHLFIMVLTEIMKLVVGDKEMILDAIYPLGEEISSELHVQTIDGNIYLVPHDDVYHTKNFNKGYFSIYEALLAGYCEVDRYSTKSFCEQVAQEIYPQILETPNI
uniref:Uncharacterized protein n=1 Tax=Acrobeloides nanus TaxID=290746 RepID=A0A914CEN8_9BILA